MKPFIFSYYYQLNTALKYIQSHEYVYIMVLASR